MDRLKRNHNQFLWNDARMFLSVVEHKNFSVAARVLGLGQSTISRRIQDLAKRLGQPLFVRGKYGAEPTPQAERLIPVARAIQYDLLPSIFRDAQIPSISSNDLPLVSGKYFHTKINASTQNEAKIKYGSAPLN